LDAQLTSGEGNGVVGTISVVATAAGVDTYTLGTDGFGARLVRFGQTVQVFDVNLTTLRGSGVITMYDLNAKQISVTPAIAGATATDKLVVNGIAAPTALPGLYGVKYHNSSASTGTWLGFQRSTTPEIRANRVNASSNALTLPLPRRAINMIGNRIGEDNTFNPVAWMHPAQQQAYESIGQLVSVIHKEAKDEKLNMYFQSMQMAGAVVKRHWNWDTTRIDFIDSKMWGRGETKELGYYTVDGRNIFELRGASGGVAAADIFYLVIGTQTFVNCPAGISYIDTLAVPSGY
jgi:hypothetical protein